MQSGITHQPNAHNQSTFLCQLRPTFVCIAGTDLKSAPTGRSTNGFPTNDNRTGLALNLVVKHSLILESPSKRITRLSMVAGIAIMRRRWFNFYQRERLGPVGLSVARKCFWIGAKDASTLALTTRDFLSGMAIFANPRNGRTQRPCEICCDSQN